MTASRDYIMFGAAALPRQRVEDLIAFHRAHQHRAHREDNMDITTIDAISRGGRESIEMDSLPAFGREEC